MKNKFSIYQVVLSAFCGVVIGAIAVLVFVPNTVRSFFVGSTAYSKMAEIEYLVEKNYYKDIDIDSIADSLALGYMFGIDDDYTTYYSKEQYEQVKLSNQGGGYGIGVTVCFDSQTQYIYIINVSADGPADNAGLRTGDLIKSIDGKDVNSKNYTELVDSIKGDVGTKVRFVIERDGKEKKVSVKRDKYTLQTVYYRMIDGLCYIQITTFNEATVLQFEKAIEFAQQEKAEGLIFDLRSNGGGLVDSASEMLDIILPKGELLVAQYKDRQEVLAVSGKNEIDLPMAVLVDEESASSSEYFASAVRDFDKGILIGNKTYGKGIMQTTYELSDGSAVKMTVATVMTKSRTQYHEKGLQPDVEVNFTEEQKKIRYQLKDDDPYIVKAIKELKKK